MTENTLTDADKSISIKIAKLIGNIDDMLLGYYPITQSDKILILDYLNKYAKNGPKPYNIETDLEPGLSGINLPNDLYKSNYATIKEATFHDEYHSRKREYNPYYTIDSLADAAYILDERTVNFNGMDLPSSLFQYKPIYLRILQYTEIKISNPVRVLYFNMRPIDKLIMILNMYDYGRNIGVVVNYDYKKIIYANGVLCAK